MVSEPAAAPPRRLAHRRRLGLEPALDRDDRRQPWTFVAGETDHFLSPSGGNFFASLYEQAIDSPCLGANPQGTTRHLILNIPMAVGRYTLGLALNQTFSYDDGTGTYENDIATSGALDVTTLTATPSRRHEDAYDAKNTVDGQFTIGVCASSALGRRAA